MHLFGRQGLSACIERKHNMQKKSRFALLIFINFIWMFLIYQGCIQLGARMESALPYQICTIAFAAAAIVLFLVYWIKTHPKEGADNVLGDKGKVLLSFFFPILIVFLLDFIDLFILQYFKQLLSSLG